MYIHGPEMPKRPRILKRYQLEPNLVNLQRLWLRSTEPPRATSLMKMIKNNYRVTYGICTTQESTLRNFSVLDTGAGTNFISQNHFPSTEVQIKSVQIPIINDANGNQLQIEGINSLFVRFVKCLVKCDFYVFERLVTAYFLAETSTTTLSAIRSQKGLVKLYEGTQIQIRRNRRIIQPRTV